MPKIPLSILLSTLIFLSQSSIYEQYYDECKKIV